MTATNLTLTNAQNSAATNLNSNITHIAVGNDNTTPTTGDTTLGSEDYREAQFSSNLSNNIVTNDLRLDVTENNGNTINEAGTFDASSGGNMYTRNLTTSFAKTSSKEAFYRIKTTFTASDNS